MLIHAIGDADAVQFAAGPDMVRCGHIGWLIKRPALDRQHRGRVWRLMTKADTASGAEIAIEMPGIMRRPPPDAWVALGEFEISLFDNHGDAKGRGGLPAAFSAVAHIKINRRAGDLISDFAALAAA